MHSHRAEFSALSIEIKGISDPMSAMAAAASNFIYQCDRDSWFFHRCILSAFDVE